MKRLLKIISIIVMVLFLSLYFSKYNNNYYENKKVLTDDAIQRFEKDLKEGKNINPKDYITPEKDYNNKAAKIGIKTSKIIEKSFNKSLKLLIKYLEKID